MDGRSWPFPGGSIELSEGEAADIMAAGWAVLDDEKDAVDRGYSVLKQADPDWDSPGDDAGEDNDDFEEEDEEYSGPEEDDGDFDRESPEEDDDFDRDPVASETPEIKRPHANSSKADWRKWVLANGAGEGEIEHFTKADLIARYGNL